MAEKNAPLSHEAVWQEFQNGLAWQRSMGFSTKWPEYERFREGRQWPDPTPATRHLPRPVFNFIRQIIRTKKSNILSQSLSLIFTPGELPGDEALCKLSETGAAAFTDFASVVWEELDQDGLNDEALECAATLGCGVFHYYWDTSAAGGGSNRFAGALRGEVLDPINVFFGDPQQRDLQRQPYILISFRRPVSELREEAARCGGDPLAVLSDADTGAEGYDGARQELAGSEKTTCLLRYFKRGGQVWWMKTTAEAVVVPPRPLHPTAPMPLYPLECFQWELRKKCAYGLGETEGLISNQKLYNFLLAMLGLSAQQTAWPKMVVRAGALQQGLTNEPGEVITDYSGAPDGVRYLQPPAFSQMPAELADLVLQKTRDLAGVNDAITGETVNLAASAILSLQSQARLPIQNIQSRFYRSIQRVGRIWEQFFKACCVLPRVYLDGKGEGRPVSRAFAGAPYADIPFGLHLDVGPGPGYSESLVMSTLDGLFKAGAITAAQFGRYAPEGLIPAGLRQELMRPAGGGETA